MWGIARKAVVRQIGEKRSIATLVAQYVTQMNSNIDAAIDKKLQDIVPAMIQKSIDRFFLPGSDKEIKLGHQVHMHLYKHLDFYIARYLERPDIQHRIKHDVEKIIGSKIRNLVEIEVKKSMNKGLEKEPERVFKHHADRDVSFP
jgi:hypothetical protein